MASIGSMAKRKSDAMAHIAEVAPAISEALGVAALDLPSYRRDPALEHTQQLEALAKWLQNVARSLENRAEAEADAEAKTGAPKKTPRRAAKG